MFDLTTYFVLQQHRRVAHLWDSMLSVAVRATALQLPCALTCSGESTASAIKQAHTHLLMSCPDIHVASRDT